ncbi:MAG: 2-dehydropantoate 2-reductase N-terminal domain-containing protein [Pseudomonadota bacterium]
MGRKKIAIVGAGAVGGYAGAYMARAGEDITFIDPWPEHVEHLRKHGLKVSHATTSEEFTTPVRALHLTEAQQLSKEPPVDIAFVCMKSYDTAWATMMIRQYLAPGGYVVSLQNCMNEETIAGIVGWGKVLGCIASVIGVELCEAGHVRRGAGRGGSDHTVFRVGEVHGRVTERAEEICRLVANADSAKVTGNLWGERWSKLVANSMQNGIVGLHRPVGRPDGAERRAASVLDPARQRGDPDRPGAWLRARGDSPSAARRDRARRRGRRGGDEAGRRAPARRLEEKLGRPASVDGPGHGQGPPAPRSSSSTASWCARVRRSGCRRVPTRR